MTDDMIDALRTEAELLNNELDEATDGEENAADQKADPMVNGHQVDPSTGEGTCEQTGKTFTAETMADLEGDCPHCGEPLSVVGEKADGAFAADILRVTPAEDDDTEYDGDVLGIGIDFPESGVYVEWRRGAFPDELEEPHVSQYGSVEDLAQATGNVVEVIETAEAGIEVKQRLT